MCCPGARRWYVAGFDRDRGEPRSFRLSRIVGAVETVGGPGAFERPEKVDLLDMVAGSGPDDARVALVRVSGSGAGQLRRIAQSEVDGVLTISFTDTALAGPASSPAPARRRTRSSRPSSSPRSSSGCAP